MNNRSASEKNKDIYISTSPFGEADKSSLAALENSGFSFAKNQTGFKHSAEDVYKAAKDCKVLIAGTEDLGLLVKNSEKIEMISRVGIGLDGVPLELCRQKGIHVSWTPDAVTSAVAEMTIGLMINSSRYLAISDSLLRKNTWTRTARKGISESVIGLIGFGRIGKAVALHLKSFNPKSVIVYDLKNKEITINALRDEGLNIVSKPFEHLISTADIVSLHVPLSRLTKNIIGSDQLAQMKPGSILINTARGGLIDEKSLYESLKNNHLSSAAIDVFNDEPYNGELTDLNNIFLTPHIGSCSVTARRDMELQAAEEAVRFLNGEELKQAVPSDEFEYASQ